MTVFETIGFAWVAFSTAMCSAAVLIAAGYSLIVGGRTVWRWIKAGQRAEEVDTALRMQR